MSHPQLSSEVIRAAYSKFSMTLSPELKQKLNGRLERALVIVQQGSVKLHPMQGKSQGRMYAVNSSDPTKHPYLVNLAARSCTCMDHWKGHYCKHRLAAQIYENACKLAENPQKSQIEAPAAPGLQAVSAVCETAPQTLSQPQANAPTALQSEAVIWAMLKHNGKTLAVEVLSLKEDLAVVRALPAVIDGGKLQPQFPFREGKSSITTFPSKDLFHVKVFRRL